MTANDAMAGKICVVTGANAGIGKETARALVLQGAHLVMVCRNKERAEDARDLFLQERPGAEIDIVLGDLSILAEVRSIAEKLLEYPRIDVLVNNAGIISPNERKVSADWFELLMATNHLGPFLLTNLVLEQLEKSDAGRIVNVASWLHDRGKIDFSDLQAQNNFDGQTQYGTSKLANILFTRELARRLEDRGVTVNCLDPGFVFSNIIRNEFPLWLRVVSWFMAQSEAKGARTSVYLATSPEVEGHSGDYYYKKRVKPPHSKALDDEVARRLWEVSAELTGL